jgi:AraC family ethanolamine operon transcriptional activator
VEAAGYSDDPSSSQLCQLAHVSERTLQYAFRERFGVSPAAFLKARRLAAAHRALLVADVSGTTVGNIIAEFGFWHLGQFGADYRRVFGETPSTTLRRPPPR